MCDPLKFSEGPGDWLERRESPLPRPNRDSEPAAAEWTLRFHVDPLTDAFHVEEVLARDVCEGLTSGELAPTDRARPVVSVATRSGILVPPSSLISTFDRRPASPTR
jgi:hypothetical protein